jgi:dipeptidase E
MPGNLLLGSGGFSTKERWDFWIDSLDQFLGDIDETLFIPYALHDHNAYTQKMKSFMKNGKKLVGIHTLKNPIDAVNNAKSIYIGGGNSFRLINQMHLEGLLEPIKKKVKDGMPYIGVSAGSNVAGPSIKTTNDMPIVYPPSFDALALVPFQINPHYFNGPVFYEVDEVKQPYGGETRDNRLEEFHEMNGTPILGIWEGTLLSVTYNNGACAAKIYGKTGNKKTTVGRLFHKGKVPIDIEPNQDLAKDLGLVAL